MIKLSFRCHAEGIDSVLDQRVRRYKVPAEIAEAIEHEAGQLHGNTLHVDIIQDDSGSWSHAVKIWKEGDAE